MLYEKFKCFIEKQSALFYSFKIIHSYTVNINLVFLLLYHVVSDPSVQTASYWLLVSTYSLPLFSFCGNYWTDYPSSDLIDCSLSV